MSAHGFENLPLINKSIRELYVRLTPQRVRQFATDFEPTPEELDPKADPIIRTQRVARHLANHFRVAVSTVVVTFNSTLPVPGRVELSSSLDFFIDLHSEHRDSPKTIAAILAHEVAHIFLHQAMIRLEPVFTNEVLTDTTAAYLGCAATILNGAQEWTTREGDRTQTHTRTYGYISLDEFGYIHAKRDFALGRRPGCDIDYGLPQAGYGNGFRRHNLEQTERPYSPPPEPRPPGFWARLFGRQPPPPPRPQRTILFTFPCACCSQDLRIPLVGKQLLVRCPTCDSRLRCYT